MAVNIGYSIGWGDITEYSHADLLFSSAYVLIGASFVGAALSVFADGIVSDRDRFATYTTIYSLYTPYILPIYSLYTPSILPLYSLYTILPLYSLYAAGMRMCSKKSDTMQR